MMMQIALSEATAARRRIPIIVCNDANGFPLPGQTFVAADVKICKNGAAEANMGGSVVEVTNQGYYYEATQAELDTRGFLRLRCAKTGLRFDGFFVDVQVGAELNNAAGLLTVTDGVESGLTVQQFMQAAFAALAGKCDGSGTGTTHYRNKADTVNRITATISSNNRTAVSLTFS